MNAALTDLSYRPNHPNVMDTRDVLERMEALRDDLRETAGDRADDPADLARWCLWAVEGGAEDGDVFDSADEYRLLHAFIEEVRQNAQDDPEDGVTLIRAGHFIDYARELVEDCGDLPRDLPWWIVVDWEATADHVRMDYTSSTLVGTEYFYR